MTDRKPQGSSFVDTTLEQAKAALTKLRGYAADHSSDLNSAIDKAGDFVNQQTGGKYRSKVGNVQSFARTQVNKLGRPSPDLGDARRAFGVDEERPTGAPGATAWRQPADAEQPSSTPGLNTQGSLADSVKDALAKVKSFAASHADDATRAVDKVATFVDDKTDHKYSAQITKVQQQTKAQVDKRLRDGHPSDDELLDPLADDAGDVRPAFDPLKPVDPATEFGLDDTRGTDRPGTV